MISNFFDNKFKWNNMKKYKYIYIKIKINILISIYSIYN